ncbi:hypothetical protein D3C81_1237810 [compost metagenome]
MGFELQLKGALQAHGVVQMLAPPEVDLCHQLTAYARCGVLVMGALEPDEGGVGIAVDHIKATRFDQLTGLAHDLVTTQGDRRCQARVEEAAATGAQNAVEGVHDDLQRLRQRRVTRAFGRLPALPHTFDDRWQAVPAAREAPPPKTCHRMLVIGLAQAFGQPYRVDQEGTDDRGVQALVVQHQYRIVETGA